MSLVKLKAKGQMTLPAKIRRQLELKQGDILSVELQGDNVVLMPKEVVDRERRAAFRRMAELGDHIREQLAKEGKTEEDLQRMIDETVEEVRAERYAARTQEH